MSKVKQGLRSALLLAVGLIAGLQLYSWNARTLAGNQLPMPLGIGAAVVMSGSMEPALSVDDLVVICRADGYEVGDVIVYQSGSSLVIHRITAIQGDTVITRGDANNTDDEPIRDVYIKGRLCFVLPGLGQAARLLKQPPVTLGLLGAALVLLELSWRKEKSGGDARLDAIKEEIRALQKELNDSEGA